MKFCLVIPRTPEMLEKCNQWLKDDFSGFPAIHQKFIYVRDDYSSGLIVVLFDAESRYCIFLAPATFPFTIPAAWGDWKNAIKEGLIDFREPQQVWIEKYLVLHGLSQSALNGNKAEALKNLLAKLNTKKTIPMNPYHSTPIGLP